MLHRLHTGFDRVMLHVVKLTWSKNTKYGWNTVTFKDESLQIFLKAPTISFSCSVPEMFTACIKNRIPITFLPVTSNLTSRENGFAGKSHNYKNKGYLSRTYFVFIFLPLSKHLWMNLVSLSIYLNNLHFFLHIE